MNLRVVIVSVIKNSVHSSWLLVLFFLLCWFSGSFVTGVQEYPKISILKWMSAESHDWEYDNLTSDALTVKDGANETIYSVSQHLVAISVACNASYPVQWVFKHFDRIEMYNVRVRSYRLTDNIYSVKSFKFSSVLEMYSDTNHVTGAYSCQRTDSDQIQNNIYIYWMGSSPPYLIHAGQTLTVKSEDNKTLILPCVVSSPDTQVILYKQTAGEYVAEPASPYIKWNPQVGFSLNLEQYDSPYGNYKCGIEGADDDDEDFVILTALQGIDTRFKINNIMEGNATFEYDKINRQIKCCSTSAKPPNMRNVFCEDPLTCKLREYSVLQGGNNGIKFRNSSCTADRIYFRDSGIVRCKGDGIDIVRHFFSALAKSDDNETNAVYFSWAEADPSKLIDVETHYRPPGGKVYSNQTMLISCDTSYYYFSEGIHWALRWRNRSLQFLNESYSAYQGYYHRSEMLHTIKLVADVEMDELICFAPIWNSTEWANKTYSLKIYQSAPPKIVGPPVLDVNWSLNQTNQSIFCIAESGKPMPFIRWKKNNRIVLNDTNTIVMRGNGSSIITFKRVSHDTQGDYQCLAGNVAGRVNKIIRVVVEVPSSSWGAVSITMIVLVVSALAGGIGVMIWKMNLQKKIIDHLAGVVFRDMSGSQAQNTTTTTPA